MERTQEIVKMIISIVENGQAKAVIRYYERNQIYFHYQCMGRGTASSELLDVLGFGGAERDVVFSLAAGSLTDALMRKLHGGDGPYAKGIAFMLPLSAISRIPGVLLVKQGMEERQGVSERQSASENRKERAAMEQQKENSLILITVNQGHTEAVMNTARGAGARGGTVLRCRFAGQEEMASIYGVPLQKEKELIAIVASAERRNTIMETIQLKHGRESGAGAVICSIGLEQMERLG